MGVKTMSNKHQKIFLPSAIIVAIVAFFVFSNARRYSREPRITFDIPFSRFSRADSLFYTKTNELAIEVKKVIEQNGLPADVFVEYKDPEESREHDATNIALGLYKLFDEYYTPEEFPENVGESDLSKFLKEYRENSDLGKLEAASPAGVWDVDRKTFDCINATLGRAALAKFEFKRQTIRKMLENRETHFSHVFVYPDSLKSLKNVRKVVSTEPSKYLSDYALLEEHVIAQALLEGNIEEATHALAYIFRIAHLASNLAAVRVRYDAAVVRLQAFEVMQRVVLAPQFKIDDMRYLREIISEQYIDWVPEFITWFGDRAGGMVLYHSLYAYELSDVLGNENFDFMISRWGEDKFRRGFKVYREADEAFYLQSMQKILDVCDRYFAERMDTLKQIREELSAKEDTHDNKGIPTEYFAATILLKDVERYMRFFAQDESALNRAMVATYSSLGQTNMDTIRDPLTGKPFQKQEEEGLIIIATEHLPRPFRVPNFTAQ